MTNDAGSKRHARWVPSPAPTRESSQALDDLIDQKQQRKEQERAQDAEITAGLRQVAERYRRAQIERDAQARWETMNEHARAHLTESVREFGSDVVTKLWRRTYDATFVLPRHLRGIVGDAD